METHFSVHRPFFGKLIAAPSPSPNPSPSFTFSLAAFVTICFAGSSSDSFSYWFSSRMEPQQHEQKAFRFRAAVCIYNLEFEDRIDALLPRCPRCGSLNERFKFERI